MSEHESTLQPTSPVERAMVARGWAEVDAAERLGPRATTEAFSARLLAERQAALDWFVAPNCETLGDFSRRTYQSDNNITRYHRMLGYLRHGETVYEVGIGRGFLATMLMRGAGLTGYRGVDLVPGNVTATREMLAANGFGDLVDIREQNLYDLTRADLEEVGATLLVCCEVIEHTPDPELALRTLAEALPEGTDLLWSVPLLGRLERVWGHSSIFSAERVRAMMAGAGLIAHHVEMVANTWLFVLASRTPAPSPRADSAVAAVVPLDGAEFGPRQVDAFTNTAPGSLTRAPARWTRRVRNPQVIVQDDQKVRVQAEGESGHDADSYAGAAFTIPPDTVGVRLQVRPRSPGLTHLYVDFRKDGTHIGRWQKKLGASTARDAAHPTFLIRHGTANANIQHVSGTLEGADTVEVFGRTAAGNPVDFTIERWAWAR